MYNSFLYNSNLFGSPAGLPLAVSSSDLIVFNGYGLQNASVITQELVQDNAPSRAYNTQKIPRNDGGFVVNDKWDSKNVSIRGVIKKDTNALLEAEMNEMKRKLSIGEANLDITTDGVIRRYVATLVNGDQMFSRRQGFHISFIPFDLVFETVDPFGKDVDYTAESLFSQTSLTLNGWINNAGTTRARPVFILQFDAASSVSAISIKNNTRNEEIILTENISTGDYVKFDTENMLVTVNGVEQDYSGVFPLLDAEGNSYTITITGSSATYSLTTKFKNTYL